MQSHCVKWHQEFEFPCKLYASASTAELEPCTCKISIRKVSLSTALSCQLGAVETQRCTCIAEFIVSQRLEESFVVHVDFFGMCVCVCIVD